MNKSLIHITNDLLGIQDQLELSEGEIDERLGRELAEVTSQLETKVDSYAYRLEKLEHMQEFWKMKAREASSVANAIDTHIKALKLRIKDSMRILGKTELRGETHVFKTRPTARAKVVIEDPEKIPKIYQTLIQEWKPSKDAILAALDAGLEVEGAHLEQSDTLTISYNKDTKQ